MRESGERLDEQLAINWRSFPLEQVNSEDENYVFWEQSDGDAKSLQAFLAAESAREQGEDVYQEFVFQLLAAVHQRKMRVQERETIEEAADAVPGMDRQQLFAGMRDPELRQRIAADYREGVDSYGVFGTPTLLFSGGDAVFVKMNQSPPDEALGVFDTVRELSCGRPFLRELKKPRKPD